MNDELPPTEPEETKTNLIPFTRNVPKRPTVADPPVPVQLPPFIKGDWIRFYNNQGNFVIGQVEYVQEKQGILHLFTDLGVVQAHAVVEHRRH